MESEVRKNSEHVNHAEYNSHTRAKCLHQSKNSNHTEYTVLNLTKPTAMTTDSFTVVNRDTQEIVIKQEPLEWEDSEACESGVGCQQDESPMNAELNSSEDSAYDSNSNSCSQSQIRCARGSLRVKLKEPLVSDVQIKPEPCSNLTSVLALQLPDVTVKIEPLDLSAAFRSHALNETGSGKTASIADRVDVDCHDSSVAAAESLLAYTNGSVEGCDDGSGSSDYDDNEMEMLSVHFEHDSDREKKDALEEASICDSSEVKVRDRNPGPKNKLKYQPCVCGQCGREFTHPKYLRSHMRVHSKVKPYTCDQCQSAFVRPADLKRHEKTHTGEKAFPCQMCQSTFADACKLKIHMRVHTGERPYKCDTCEQSFSQLSQHARHKRKHKGERPHQCPCCPSAFTMISDYRRHLKIHTGEKPFVCPHCPARFIEAKNLRVHQRIHTGEKPFQCHVCKMRFAQVANLARHIRTHTGERPVQCQLCPSSFADTHKLTVHMRSHSGEKPYRCTLCPAAFSTSSSLNRHKVALHDCSKPFRCQHCPARFSQKCKLKLHLACHDCGAPFQCQQCSASFSNNYALTIHLHVHKDP